jgi:uncharacterized membrane protein (UPF0127 family)
MKKEKQVKNPLDNGNGKTRKYLYFVLPVVALLIALYFIFSSDYKKETSMEKTKIDEPQFVKNGELIFEKKSSKNIIKKIDVEIADNENKRMQGLMWRRSMSDSLGMLFIFDDVKPLSFWMKNTYIPLDIIYINQYFEIVTIQENTTPFSEVSIPSYKPAKYVVEVNAGFCFKNKIEAGDNIIYNTVK